MTSQFVAPGSGFPLEEPRYEKKKRPRGNKRNATLVAQDRLIVTRMLARGDGRQTILAHFSSRANPPSKRQVDEWIQYARRQWQEDHADELPTIRESTLAHLRAQREYLKKRGEYAVMARYDGHIIDILGLKTPDKHLHLHAEKVTSPRPRVDLSRLSSAQLEALEKALMPLPDPEPTAEIKAFLEPPGKPVGAESERVGNGTIL